MRNKDGNTSKLKSLKSWSTIGFYTIVVLGFLYHYLFEWTNRSVIIGMMAPVNESVWEHLKLGLWAVLTFSLVEYFVLYEDVSNFFFAKAVGILILSGTILLVFYSYTLFSGRPILLLDISSYLLGVLFCQLFSFKIFQSAHSSVLNLSGMIILVGLCILFAAFTFYPPKLELFLDHTTNTYGLGAK